MHTSEYIKAYGVSNFSSIEEIRASEWFQLIMNSETIQNSSDLSTFWEHISSLDFSESWKNKEYHTMDLDTLRSLKQALNNQICLYVFEVFLSAIKNLQNNEIPWIKLVWERTIAIKPVTLHDFILLHDENTKWAATIHGKSVYSQKFVTSQVSNTVLSLIFPNLKRKLIAKYISLFEMPLQIYFKSLTEDIFQWIDTTIWEDIIKVYLLLENLIMHITQEEVGKSFCSYTPFIIPNSNRYLLEQFIKHDSEKNIDIDEITEFLEKQTKAKLRLSMSHDAAQALNGGNIRFDACKGIYDVLTHKNKTDDFQHTELGWCPFAKSQIQGKNAFVEMHRIFDMFYVRILKELQALWITH